MAEDHELKIESQDDAVRAIIDISKRVKELKAHGEAGKTELATWKSKMVDDLKKAQQRITELTQQASVTSHAGGKDAEFKAFVDSNNDSGLASQTKGIVFKGGLTPDGEWRSGLFDCDVEPVNEWHEKALQLVDQRNLVKAIRKNPRNPYGPGEAPITERQLARHMQNAPEPIRRIFGDATDIGAEWIPDQHMPMLERDLRMSRRLEGIFQAVPMSDKELRLPFLSSQGLTPYKKGVNVTDDPGQYRSTSKTTKKQDLTAIGLAVRTQVDEDAAEDSIIDAQGICRQELVAAIIDGKEDAIVNGDSAGTHQDTLASWNPRSRWAGSPLGLADDHRTTWLGLRAQAFDNSAAATGAAAQTYAGFLAALKTMDSPHGTMGDTVMIVSPEYYITVLGFDEVITLDKFGPNASILTGQIASLAGRPVIQTEFLTADTEDSGLFTGGGGLHTSYLITNRARFKMGNRRGMAVELDKDITRGLFNMVSTWRGLFFDLDFPVSKKNNVLRFEVD